MTKTSPVPPWWCRASAIRTGSRTRVIADAAGAAVGDWVGSADDLRRCRPTSELTKGTDMAAATLADVEHVVRMIAQTAVANEK